ncbi:MAG: signal peptidase II [Leptolyngbya sp.]|nr:signal peptidase II [Candidatus Melainabacteria bacterium]
MTGVKFALAFLTIAITCSLDKLSKDWALKNLQMHNTEPFMPGFLQFTLTTNTGAAFSFGQSNAMMMAVLATLLTVCVGVWLISRIVRSSHLPIAELIGISCILGGSAGNLIDRFTLGHVIDFLEFSFFTFPVFNVADTFINVGLGLILLSRLGVKEKEDEEEKAEKDASSEVKTDTESQPQTISDKTSSTP